MAPSGRRATATPRLTAATARIPPPRSSKGDPEPVSPRLHRPSRQHHRTQAPQPHRRRAGTPSSLCRAAKATSSRSGSTSGKGRGVAPGRSPAAAGAARALPRSGPRRWRGREARKGAGGGDVGFPPCRLREGRGGRGRGVQSHGSHTPYELFPFDLLIKEEKIAPTASKKKKIAPTVPKSIGLG